MTSYENIFGRLDIEELSKELPINRMNYDAAPEDSKYSISDLEKISVISNGAVSITTTLSDKTRGFIYIFTSRNTAKYVTARTLTWNNEYDFVIASEQLADRRCTDYKVWK